MADSARLAGTGRQDHSDYARLTGLRVQGLTAVSIPTSNARLRFQRMAEFVHRTICTGRQRIREGAQRDN
jgi:hypothetical protein